MFVAEKIKFNAIITDLQITKDRKIVVCHDNDLERLTGTSSLISETEFVGKLTLFCMLLVSVSGTGMIEIIKTWIN